MNHIETKKEVTTQEDIDRERIKRSARKSHLDFVKHTWTGGGADPFIVGVHTKIICEKIDEAIERFKKGQSSFLKIKVHPRSGKALELSTPIPTPRGWTTIGEIKIGDKLFDEAGNVCKVIGKSPVFKDRDCYTVETLDGEKIIADGEHEWVTRLCRHHKKHLRHTTEYLSKRKSPRRAMITAQGALKLPKAELLIDPYVLGVWLGDGKTFGGFVTPGVEADRLFITSEIEKAGYVCRAHKNIGNVGILTLIPQLKKLNLFGNKHIPMIYKRASREQRLALLQGLVDTDGYVAPKGHIEICSVKKLLAEDIRELVMSLGYKCSLNTGDATINGRFISKKYRVMFFMPDAARLPRKRDNCVVPKHTPNRYIDVKPYGKADTVCIQVSAESGMFLCGRTMLPTHNSDLVSRYLQPHFIGMFPDCEMMDTCYNSSLAEAFAFDSIKIMNTPEYQELYPNVKLDQESVKRWSVLKLDSKTKQWVSAKGKSNAGGLYSGLTGKGYHLGILDDYCSSRADAESKTMREKMWSAFTNDFLSRRAPVSITIILATQWHEDDIHGRIERKNDPECEEYDEKFPKFETLSFPARAEMYHTPSDYPGEYLFLERFSREFYEAQYATLTPYESSALYDCSPISKGGAILKTDKINYCNEMQVQEWPKDLKWLRVWDMAHTAKQRTGSDPDYTAGTLLAYRKGERNAIGEYQWHLYIKNYVKFRENATQRDNKIIEIAKADGNSVKIVIENSLDAKDAAYYLQDRLSGIRTVHPVNCKGDKVTRCSPVEAIFEYGRVHVAKGEWNKTWAEELLRFDGSGKSHDEAIDNITAGWIAGQESGYKALNISVG